MGHILRQKGHIICDETCLGAKVGTRTKISIARVQKTRVKCGKRRLLSEVFQCKRGIYGLKGAKQKERMSRVVKSHSSTSWSCPVEPESSRSSLEDIREVVRYESRRGRFRMSRLQCLKLLSLIEGSARAFKRARIGSVVIFIKDRVRSGQS